MRAGAQCKDPHSNGCVVARSGAQAGCGVAGHVLTLKVAHVGQSFNARVRAG
jgi:hypothetical protein